MEKQIDKLINDLDDILCGCGINANSVNAVIRVLGLIKELRDNVVGLSDEDFESMITKAINDETKEPKRLYVDW